MPRAATDVMQSVIFSAVLDAIAALKDASGGLPNNLLRQVQAIHNNVTFADLPKELQDAITRMNISSSKYKRLIPKLEERGCSHLLTENKIVFL